MMIRVCCFCPCLMPLLSLIVSTAFAQPWSSDFQACASVTWVGQRVGQNQESRQAIKSTAECMADRAVAKTLDVTLALLNEQGKVRFGQGFHIDSSLNHSLSKSGGIDGDLDVVVPFYSYSNGPMVSRSLFFQNGITRWTDSTGLIRNDTRFGFAHRFTLNQRQNNIIGMSALFQQNLERGHERLVIGMDYAGAWGKGSLSYFLPMTDWEQGRIGYEERAIKGMELGLQLEPTSTIALNMAAGRWENKDGSNTWTTRGRLGLEWHPHTQLEIRGNWNDIGTSDSSAGIQATVLIPFGGGETKRPRWKGFGLAGVAKVQPSDIWRTVANVNRIEFAERKATSTGSGTGTDTVIADAQVRFLQSNASSGSEIKLEVTLTAPVYEDVRLLVKLAPGSGNHPAVPGEDYTDEPVEVLIRQGEARGTAIIQLLHNPDMMAERVLRVVVHSI